MDYSIIQIIQFEEGLRYVPSFVSKESIDEICPYMTKKGKPYRNVSILERHGKSYTVVGNYRVHREALMSKGNEIGYKKDGKGY